MLSHMELFSIARWSERIAGVEAAEARLMQRLDADLPWWIFENCRVPITEAIVPLLQGQVDL